MILILQDVYKVKIAPYSSSLRCFLEEEGSGGSSCLYISTHDILRSSWLVPLQKILLLSCSLWHHRLHWSVISLYIRAKKQKRSLSHWNRLSREVLEIPSSESFKIRVDKTIKNIILEIVLPGKDKTSLSTPLWVMNNGKPTTTFFKHWELNVRLRWMNIILGKIIAKK